MHLLYVGSLRMQSEVRGTNIALPLGDHLATAGYNMPHWHIHARAVKLARVAPVTLFKLSKLLFFSENYVVLD